jgi:hypothetical protein
MTICYTLCYFVTCMDPHYIAKAFTGDLIAGQWSFANQLPLTNNPYRMCEQWRAL